MDESEFDTFECRPRMVSDEELRLRSMEQHVEKMASQLALMLSKQHEWEENQRWQINQIRQTLRSLHRDVSFGLLLLLIFVGYTVYRNYW
jgi:hypothetical protein